MPAAPSTRIRIVQSRQNASVRELRAALARPGTTRNGSEKIGLEGLHLLEEAFRSGLSVQTIFVRQGSEALLDPLFSHAARAGALRLDTIELIALPPELLASVVSTETPQPLAALAVPPAFSLDELFPPGRAPLLLVLAGLQDPGNLGTILRSSEAFGATGVLSLPGTVSQWNPKSLRASMGSAFRLPVLAATLSEARALLSAAQVCSLGAVAPAHPGAALLGSVDLTGPVALWIGNEGAGLDPASLAACDRLLTIPCPGPVESLNAAIAAGVLLYETSRQRASDPAAHTDPENRSGDQ